MPAEHRLLSPGDHAPWFRAPALGGNPNYVFDSAAGRHILLLFFGTAADAGVAAALQLVTANRALFDDSHACFFGVSVDPQDAAQGRIAQSLPGIRYFLDHDQAVSIAYGALPERGSVRYVAHWLLLDPNLQVAASYTLTDGVQAIRHLEELTARPESEVGAPVLLVPRVLEPEFCRILIARYEEAGGHESGFMREVNGRTVEILDPHHKRRSDWTIDDQMLRKQLAARMGRRIRPAVQRSFQFDATRLERYIVACYDGAAGGHFRAHRDNTTKGTAHRRFAVTINLNAGDYDGGDLRFPEFGQRTYRAPTGGAIVFSCGLLHEATPVTRGRRYAFLPFLYDDEAARIRKENNIFLGEDVQKYEE